MHLETLRLYCDVVRLRSFSRGAEQNFVSQSAASQAVQQLERQLGVALIDRTKRPFVVTPEGEAFYAACRALLESLGEGQGRDRRRSRRASTAPCAWPRSTRSACTT